MKAASPRRDGRAGAILALRREHGHLARSLERALFERGFQVAHVEDAGIGFAMTRLGFIAIVVGALPASPPVETHVFALEGKGPRDVAALVEEALGHLRAARVGVAHAA